MSSTLADCVTFINGDRGKNYPKQVDFANGEVPFVSASDLSNNTLSNASIYQKKITKSAYEKLRSGKVVKQDILLCLRGSLGKLGVVSDDMTAAIASSLVILRPHSQTNSKFLFQWLKSPDFQQTLASFDNGSVQGNLSVKSISKIAVPNFSPSDQKAIAHILGTLDDKIELNQKMNQTLEEITKAIFKSWFVDFDPVRAKAEGRPTCLPPEISDLFPNELVDSEIGEIPKGWEVNPLGSVFVIQYGKNLPTSNLIEKGYPVFGGNGVIGFHSKYLYEEVMTLIACRGAASGKVGRSLPKSFVTNNSLVINHQGAGVTSQRFIEFILANGATENYVTGSAQPQLTIDNIKNFPFITPSSKVVDSFQGIVNPLADRQLLLDSESQVLSELRDTLLPKLISGELRLPDAEKFPEEEGI